jgi:amino acid adenylation domain-containing protein
VEALFEAQAARTPRAIAIREQHGSSATTFEQLRCQSEELADALTSSGIGLGCSVAIGVGRCTALVVSMLGVLKAGAAYVPIDVSDPAERLSYILKDSQASALIVAEDTRPSLSGLPASLSGKEFVLENDTGRVARKTSPAGNATSSASLARVPSGVAYIMYTSGSTGKPKGCLGTHAGIVNRCSWMHSAFPFKKEEVSCAKTSIAFVDSVWEIFGPLLAGVTNVMVSDDVARNSHALLSLVEQHCISRIVVVPVLLQALLDAVDDEGLTLERPRGRSLNIVTVSGDVLDVPLADRFSSLLPHCALLNLYGSTEVAGDVTCFEVTRKVRMCAHEGHISIGTPIVNCAVHILDEQLQLVPAGTVGEICITGPNVAAGYWRVPKLTAEKFVINPVLSERGIMFRTGDRGRALADGSVQFVGRIDRQVTLRGHRIELGEVEAVIRARCGAREAAVTLCGTALRQKQLVAYVTPASMDQQSVLRGCISKLPIYMVPTTIVCLDELPMTSSGKIDRLALLATEQRQSQARVSSTPRSESTADGTESLPPGALLEIIVARVWQDLLNLETAPARDDSWFEVGGDSLLVVSMLEKVTAAVVSFAGHCATLNLVDVVAAPTVAGLCAVAVNCANDSSCDPQSQPRKQKRARTEASNSTTTTSRGAELKVLTLATELHTTVIEPVRLDGSSGWLMAAGTSACLSRSSATPTRCWVDMLDARVSEHCRISSSCISSISTISARILKKQWSYDTGACIDGAPAWLLEDLDVLSGVVVVASHSGVVAAVSARSGREHWRTQLGGRIDASVCICTTSSGEVLACIGSYNGTVYFLAVSDGRVAWKFQTGDECKCLACAEHGSEGGLVWVGSHDRSVYALSVRQLPGECVYRMQTRGSVLARPCAINLRPVSHALIASQDGMVRAVAKHGANNYRVCWERDVGAPVFAGVVDVGTVATDAPGAIVTDVTARVHCLNVRTGEHVWIADCSSGGSDGDLAFVTPTVLYMYRVVLVPLRSGRLVCLSATDGEVIWSIMASDGNTAAPVALTSVGFDRVLSSSKIAVVCVATSDGTVLVYSIAALEGSSLSVGAKEQRKVAPPRLLASCSCSKTFCAPLMHSGHIMIGARDNCLHCLSFVE